MQNYIPNLLDNMDFLKPDDPILITRRELRDFMEEYEEDIYNSAYKKAKEKLIYQRRKYARK